MGRDKDCVAGHNFHLICSQMLYAWWLDMDAEEVERGGGGEKGLHAPNAPKDCPSVCLQPYRQLRNVAKRTKKQMFRSPGAGDGLHACRHIAQRSIAAADQTLSLAADWSHRFQGKQTDASEITFSHMRNCRSNGS